MSTLIHESANIYESTIGKNTKVAAFTEIGGASIGDNCKIQAFTFICPGVTIGNNVFIGPHVCFTNDKNPRCSDEWILSETIIEDNVSIGAGSVILPVRIGKNTVIGAGSIVTKDVPENSVVYGECAKCRQ